MYFYGIKGNKKDISKNYPYLWILKPTGFLLSQRKKAEEKSVFRRSSKLSFKRMFQR